MKKTTRHLSLVATGGPKIASPGTCAANSAVVPISAAPRDDDDDPIRRRDRTEAASPVINAAVTYIQAMAGRRAGYAADHTCNLVVAGWEGGPGRREGLRAERALRKLTRLCRAHAGGSIVEMRAKASVAAWIVKSAQSREWEPQDQEFAYLAACAADMEHFCEGLYAAECEALVQ